MNMRILKTKTEDNIEFSGLLSEAPQSKKIIIHIHGMSGDFYTNDYLPAMYQDYPANGWSFLAGENRGTHSITQFRKESDVVNGGNTYEVFEDCIKDINAWINAAKQLGYETILLQSHSLGTSKTAYFMHETQSKDVSGLIWLSPSDMVGLVHDPIGQKDHDIMYKEAQSLVAEGKSKQILSHQLWGSVLLSAGTYLNFFDDASQSGIFNYKRPDLGWKVVNALSVPVIAFTGTNDDGILPVIDPKAAMEMLKGELRNAPMVTTVVYNDCDHDFTGYGSHVVKDVLDFVRE